MKKKNVYDSPLCREILTISSQNILAGSSIQADNFLPEDSLDMDVIIY